MLPYILAFAVALGSFAIYMAAFFFPEVHRKGDLVWSGVGLFYALVLWFCAGRITGAVLLGQMASVGLLSWFGWQALALRRQTTPVAEQTPVSGQQLDKLPGGMKGLFKGKSAQKPTAAPAPEMAPVPEAAAPAESAAAAETALQAEPVAETVRITPKAQPIPPAQKPKAGGLAGRVFNLFKGKPKPKPAPQPQPQPTTGSPLDPVATAQTEVEAAPTVEPQPMETSAPPPATEEMPEQVEQMPAAAALEGATAEAEVSEDEDFGFDDDLEEAEATAPQTATVEQTVTVVSPNAEIKVKSPQDKVAIKPTRRAVTETSASATGLLTKIQAGIRGLLNARKSPKSKPAPQEKPAKSLEVEPSAGVVEEATPQEETPPVVETESAIAPTEVAPAAGIEEPTPPQPPSPEQVEAATESSSEVESAGRLTPEPVEEYAPEAELTPVAQTAIASSQDSDLIVEAQQAAPTEAAAEMAPAHPSESEGSEEQSDRASLRPRRQDPAVVDAARQPAEAPSQPTPPSETEDSSGEG